MEACFERAGEVVVVELKGRLDFATSDPFRRTCQERLTSEKLVFDLGKLNFVGSLGLKDFVDTMDYMARSTPTGIKCCGVSSEFRRLFEATGIIRMEIYETREKALLSYSAPSSRI